MLSSYHNHSTWSDGHASIREMALAAKASGVTEFGISDHFVVGPRGFFRDARAWSMSCTNLDRYVSDALSVKSELESVDFHVRVGLEVDYFPETVDALNRRLSRLPLDYVIGAVHFAGEFPVDASAGYWRRLSQEEQRGVWRVYTRRVRECAERLSCNWLAHLDLAKIYGVPAPEECLEDFREILSDCAKTGLCIEINAAGLDKACAEAYPAPGLLQFAINAGVDILVNADAHFPTQIVRHFPELRSLAQAMGVKRFPYFAKREKRFVETSRE